MIDLKEGYNGITDPETIKDTKDPNVIYIEKISEDIKDVIFVTGADNKLELNCSEDARKRICGVHYVYEDENDINKDWGPFSNIAYVLYRSTPTIKVRYHKELCPELIEIEKNPIGDFIDLRAAETVELYQGQFKLISLGISVQLPKGYHAEVVPRSSTYKNFGIIMSNSIGIIDESYCGDNDIWRFPAIAMRDTKINVNDRICQFRIVRNRDINIEVVDKLDNEDRGGIGSTGKN
jgi:dUTP pyrophosphatase